MVACAAAPQPTQETLEAKILHPPKLTAGASFELGGLSGLHFLAKESARKKTPIFVSLTDRGPNAEPVETNGKTLRPFPLPSFRPQIVWLEIANGKARVVKKRSLSASGLPNSAKLDESPVDMELKAIPFDKNGIDPEGIVQDARGNFWIVEEYGPSLLKVSPEGKILKRFIPFGSKEMRNGIETLPSFLTKRRKNRGFEGVALKGNKIYMALQSPPAKGASYWAKSNAVPIVVFDLKTEKTLGVYAYPFADSSATKVGALAVAGNQSILLLEQNSKTNKKAYKAITLLDLKNALNLCPSPDKCVLESIPKGIRPVQTKKRWNLTDRWEEIPEKLEGLGWIGGNRVALISDNDFNIQQLHKPESPPEPTKIMLIELPGLSQ